LREEIAMRTKAKKKERSHVYILRTPESDWRRFAERCRQNGWAYSWVLRRLVLGFADGAIDVSPTTKAKAASN
jgi:hypothetical protein